MLLFWSSDSPYVVSYNPRTWRVKIGSPLPHRRARIEIIPLIDIMFFLLASFMMASLSMIRLQSVKNMELPAATSAKRDFKPDIVNIAVSKEGVILLENKKVEL